MPGKTGAVAGLDGRRRAAKRLRSIAAEMEAQFAAPLTDAQRAAIKRASELVLAAELARGSLVRGEPVAIAEVVKLENLAARALRALGIGQRVRPAAPVPLRERLAAEAAEVA
jgi:hypothetical protein